MRGRVGQTLRALRGDPAHLARRVSRRAYQRLGAADLDVLLGLDDVADSRGLTLAVPDRRPARGTPLTVGWVCAPPARAPAATPPCSGWSRRSRPRATPACSTCTTGSTASCGPGWS
ncbi:hypothetical protein [Micromonospora zhanjiangensis]